MRGALAEVRRCSYEAAFILFGGPKEFRQTISGARQCRPCRLFAPRKALWCARRCMPLPRMGMTRRLRRGSGACTTMFFRQLRCPKVSKGRVERPLVRPQAHTPCPGRGMTRRLRRGLGLAVLWGVHTFLSVAKEKCAKESQRHGDSGKKPFTAHF